MFRKTTALTVGAAVAAATLMTAGAVRPAAAALMHRHHHYRHVARMRVIPAHQRPGYVGAPGFAGGPPGPVVPGLIDPGSAPGGAVLLGVGGPAQGGLLGGGGLLGTGVPLQTGLFTGIPVLGPLGL